MEKAIKDLNQQIEHIGKHGPLTNDNLSDALMMVSARHDVPFMDLIVAWMKDAGVFITDAKTGRQKTVEEFIEEITHERKG